ncbi:Arm DNA-binding domain-containing protein [Pectobacterium sp. PL64]|uniref:Arm DNA-binding domain-containing protein n=1 Tax=Pectobacterium sp. PL64 TaxID=2738983 RepID=UPI001F0B7C5E|nr:Arm DNA-binding domain-containing protein [Pectobacterium sp. PL64]UMO89658.1 Arm DNA-binding domain-containing protein [Pectobacterium sp. PL64]
MSKYEQKFYTFPGAITECETIRPSFTPYGLNMTQAQYNFYGTCREVVDGDFPELKAMVNRNENIRFFVRYIFNGNVRYDYLGEFPTLSIAQARNKARYIASSNEDEATYADLPF